MDTNPVDWDLNETTSVIAHVLDESGIPFEIDEEGSVRAICEGAWHGFDIWFVHNDNIQALHICASLRLVKQGDSDKIHKVIAILNERLWLGHLELWQDPSEVVWRYTLPNPVTGDSAVDQIIAILQGVKDAADRFAPVCELVLQGQCGPEDAVRNALFETMGEA